MDAIEYLPGEAPPPHIAIDRQVVVGETQFLITASGGGGRRIQVAVVGCDRDGRVVSEISGGIAPRDLPAVAEVLASTLAGMVALHHRQRVTGPSPRRRPRHGTRRWPEADAGPAVAHRGDAGRCAATAGFGPGWGSARARLIRLELRGAAPPAPGVTGSGMA